MVLSLRWLKQACCLYCVIRAPFSGIVPIAEVLVPHDAGCLSTSGGLLPMNPLAHAAPPQRCGGWQKS